MTLSMLKQTVLVNNFEVLSKAVWIQLQICIVAFTIIKTSWRRLYIGVELLNIICLNLYSGGCSGNIEYKIGVVVSLMKHYLKSHGFTKDVRAETST
jgi:hypothetical protein